MNLIADDVMRTYGKPMHIVAIIPSATKMYMTEKIPFVFRQNTDFLYLSGCLEPDTALILSGSSAKTFISTMLVRPNDPHAILWDGPRTGEISNSLSNDD
jgi:Xaa-Pro aminopeptidase